jgi:transcription elongation regulator 1
VNLLGIISDFFHLLQETKMLTHRSFSLCDESEQHLREVVEVLRKDRRYLMLECMPEARLTILTSYLEELHKRGPPPPPTASEPTRRK